MSTEEPPIQDQVWDAVDPTGDTRDLIDAVSSDGGELASWVSRLGVDVGDSIEELGALGAKYRILVDSITDSVRVLGPRGWAVMYMQSEAVARAVKLTQEGQGEAADELLADQWEGEGDWRLKRVCDRVGVMGAGDEELGALFRERARLLGLAREHHASGRYDASVPILLSQMEGITMDVTGGAKFFTKAHTKADLVDPTDLVSIASALSALQATYGQDVRVTQAAGSLSRHGVLHGRELAYDTRVISAKTWSVTDALVQWALSRARATVEARRAERQSSNAGTEAVDERGRRVDDREFAETCDVLRLMRTSAIGWYNRGGRFRDDIVGGTYAAENFVKHGLPRDHGVRQRVRADGEEVAYWRRTESGWVLGIGVASQERGFGEYLYSGPEEPSGFGAEQGSGWAGLYEGPADWT